MNRGGDAMKRFMPGRLIERRKRLKKSQQQVAVAAGLSLALISYIENGRKVPRATTLIPLAGALRCKVDYFFA